MDGPRESHAEWSKLEKEKYALPYTLNLKRNDTNELICKTDSQTSLVIQWLRLHALTAGDLCSTLGQRTRSPMPQPRSDAAKFKLWNKVE